MLMSLLFHLKKTLKAKDDIFPELIFRNCSFTRVYGNFSLFNLGNIFHVYFTSLLLTLFYFSAFKFCVLLSEYSVIFSLPTPQAELKRKCKIEKHRRKVFTS